MEMDKNNSYPMKLYNMEIIYAQASKNVTVVSDK